MKLIVESIKLIIESFGKISGTINTPAMSFLYTNSAPDSHVIRMVELDPDEKMTSEERRIRTLMEIRRLQPQDFWMVAEQEWEKNVNMSIGFIERRQALVNSLTNEIYQLVGFSAAFQGLLLTAASQASRLSCNTKWWVLALSLFATVVTAAGVRGKTKSIARLQEAMHKETPHKMSVMHMLRDLQQNGPDGFDFSHEEKHMEQLLVPNELTCFQKVVRLVSAECSYNSKIFYCLIIFGILCLLSLQYILCD